MRMLAAARADARAMDDPQKAAAMIVAEGAGLVHNVECVLCVAQDGDSFEVRAASGRLSGIQGVRGSLKESLVARAIDSRTAMVEPVGPERQPVLGRFLAEAGACTVWAAPLLSRGGYWRETLGALLMARFDGQPFSDEDLRVMDAYNALVSLSTMRRLQREDAERASRRYALGVDVALDLGTAESPAEVIERLLARAVGAVGADRGTLLRLDDDTLEIAATRDVDGKPTMPGFRLPVSSQSVLATAMETRSVVRDRRLDLEGLPEPLRTALQDVSQLLVLPLVLGGDIIGFLSVHRRSDEPFDDEDVATLQLIGNVAAVTLRNADLLQDMDAARRTMGEFLNVVVHELRAPLTIISGYINMMDEGIFGAAPPAWHRPMETIELKLREGQRLVDELLIIARLEDGNIPYRLEDFDARAEAERAVQRALPRANLSGATIEVRGDTVVSAHADAAHVARILDNLINNALMHGGTPAAISVTVSNHGAPAITVADNGPGVPSDERDRVFERFFHGRASAAGTGLGLYISRQLAERWGGSLLLTDEGPGARFVLRLPPAGGDASARDG